MSTTTITTESGTVLEKGAIGQSIPRKEDKRLVQGQGVFFDDIRRHGTGYVHFVRSPYAHAKIVSIDVTAALALDGVYGTITGDEVAIHTDPFFEMSTPPGANIKDYALAVGKVRFQGEPVAAVCAATRELARDAAELVEVEYEPLDVLVDAEEAAEGRGRPARRGRLEHRLVGRVRLGRRRPGARRGRPRREDQAAPLPPLQLDAARVLRARSSSTSAAPASGRSTATTRCRASARSGWRPRCAAGSTSCASSRRTSAARSATRSASTRTTSSSACWRGSSGGRCSGRSGAPTSTRRTRTGTSARSSTSRSR